MPLTLELIGRNPENSGHLIIDRNNLIIAYYADSSKESIDKAHANRQKAGALIWNAYAYSIQGRISQTYPLIEERNFAETEDPRHDALEHLSSYDRYKCKHAHIIFKSDITFGLIHLIFSNIQTAYGYDVISKNCINNILNISRQYFLELDNSSTAKNIETEYRALKEIEFRKATLAVKNAGNKFEPSLDSTLSFETKTIATEEIELDATTPTTAEIEFQERLQNIRRSLLLFDANDTDIDAMHHHPDSSSSSASNTNSDSEEDFNSYSGMRAYNK